MLENIISEGSSAKTAPLVDGFGREMRYLRLSVTDRCNLRCSYCMRTQVKFVPRADVLTLEEMERLCVSFMRLGIRKIRLTGGEPLLRPNVMWLIERLGKRIDSGELCELVLTTNGTQLARHAEALRAAGVRRINVSLDTLDEAMFHRVTRGGTLPDVLAGIHAALAVGLSVRINTVAMAGVNDTEYERLIDWSVANGCDLALIELMPFGNPEDAAYQPLEPVRQRLARHRSLTPSKLGTGGPCQYWNIGETGRRIGFITPMSHSFCENCNRLRVTCTGRLLTCMAHGEGSDLLSLLRDPMDETALDAAIVEAVKRKPESHRMAQEGTPEGGQRMWQMGG